MKLAIVGYGKMGRMIEQFAPEYGFEVALKLDIQDNPDGKGLTAERFAGIDAAIEFSTPQAVLANLRGLIALKVPTVVGTTGWNSHLQEVRAAVEQAGAGLIWSPNYSIGVNIFWRLAAEAARAMAAQPGYEAWGWEIHHSAKKDAPSGTLIQTLEAMRRAGYERKIDASSNRAGAHPGTHEIGFDSAADTLTIRHAARSREGFARGALHAARWLPGHRGFFEFSEVLFGAKENA